MKRTGVRLRAFAARWFDAAAMERFIDPVLADLQSEYEEAIGRGCHWRGRWIWMAGHVGLVKVALWHQGRRLVTLGELRRLLAIGSPTSWPSPPADVSDLTFAYHQRWAGSFAPIALSVLALCTALRWRSRRLPVVCATIAALAAYPLIQHTARVVFDGGLPRSVAAWAANAALLTAAAIVWTRQPSNRASQQPSSA